VRPCPPRIPALAAQHEPDHHQHRLHRAGHVRERCGREHLARALQLLGVQRARALQDQQRAPAGVEFDRQRQQREQRVQAQADDGCEHQPPPQQRVGREHEAQDREPGPGAGGDRGHRHEGLPGDERLVGVGVLDGMAHLMRGDADGRQRRAVVHRAGEPERLVARVVVVGQFACDAFDGDVRQAVGVQQASRHLGAREPGASRDPAVTVIGRFRPRRRPKREQDRGTDDEQVQRIEVHHASATPGWAAPDAGRTRAS
jgi:hypothetical protein